MKDFGKSEKTEEQIWGEGLSHGGKKGYTGRY